MTRELNNYEKFELLMDAETLRIVGEHRAHLSISPVDLELIIRSAAESNIDVKEWMGKLADLGPRRTRVLARMMSDSEEQVRATAYEYLPEIADPDLMSQLISGLQDTKAAIRDKARTVLDAMQPELAAALHGSGVVERAEAALALGRIAPEKYINDLLDSLSDHDDEYRDVIVGVLEEVRDDELIAGVTARLSERVEQAPWALAMSPGVSSPIAAVAGVGPSAKRRNIPRLTYASVSPRRSPQLRCGSQALQQALRVPDQYGASDAARRSRTSPHSERSSRAAATAGRCSAVTRCSTAFVEQALIPPLEKAWGDRTEGTLMGSAVVSSGTALSGSRDGLLYAIGSAGGTTTGRCRPMTGSRPTPVS